MEVDWLMKMLLFLAALATMLFIVTTLTGMNKPASTIVFTPVLFYAANKKRAARKKGELPSWMAITILVAGLALTVLIIFGLWSGSFAPQLVASVPETFAKIFG
jgi:hypothetical protein